MSEKVYGICGTNKCKREVYTKDQTYAKTEIYSKSETYSKKDIAFIQHTFSSVPENSTQSKEFALNSISSLARGSHYIILGVMQKNDSESTLVSPNTWVQPSIMPNISNSIPYPRAEIVCDPMGYGSPDETLKISVGNPAGNAAGPISVRVAIMRIS